ncbi:hypothetical protein LSH36_104g05043 [Paralvinella palmiformis]|uniref:C2H2-type domain-containing protein n=1 Tax=Paralvinella palmiformis TaxID=53620 RepID=A0AAD9NB43_9ANNE|nr:hypothetical protein LSH36_104g05043 [Paralvinella palmiformis]
MLQTLEPLFSHQPQSCFNQSGENQHVSDQSWRMGPNFSETNHRNWSLTGAFTREMNILTPYMRSFGRQRRTPTSSSKQFICGYPGCDKSYFSRTNMLHHQAYKHGRQKGEPGPCIVKNVQLSDDMNLSDHFATPTQNGPQLEMVTTKDTSSVNIVDNPEDNGVGQEQQSN